MAAPTITAHIIEDGYVFTKGLFTALFGSSQETAAVKIDLSTLTNVDPADAGQTCSIEALKWNASGAGVVQVNLAGSPATVAAELSGMGEICGGNLSPANGDVTFTTTGMASGDTYQVEVTIKKLAGFVNVPVAITAEITNESADIVAGDTIAVEVAFNTIVHVVGNPQITVELDSDVFASYVSGSGTDTLTFEYVVLDADHAEAGDVNVGDIIPNGSGQITGGFADSPARLSGFDVTDPSSFNVNKFVVPTVTLVAGTGPRYDTGETVTFTATYTHAVTVTGSPRMAMTLTSGNKNATYVSGSGTTALTFSYTPVAVGDISNAGTVSVASPIALNSGTIKDAHGHDAVLTFTPPSMTGVSFNHA